MGVFDKISQAVESQREQAEQAFLSAALEQAHAAHANEHRYLQVEIPHSEFKGVAGGATKGRSRAPKKDVIGAIEDVGWRLQHVGYVYVMTGQDSRDKFQASGQQVAVLGRVVGIYLFRRAEAARSNPSVKSSAKAAPKLAPEVSTPWGR